MRLGQTILKAVVGLVVLFALGGVTAALANAGRSYTYGGTAMLPTMARGDAFYIEPVQEVRRGDFVAFRLTDIDVMIAMRVVGLPGDLIRIEGGNLTLNGRAVSRLEEGRGPGSVCEEESRLPLRVREILPDGVSYLTYDCGPGRFDDVAEFIVPSGRYFLLGDNRDAALDSRPPKAEGGLGFVPAGAVVGMVHPGRPPLFKGMMRSLSRDEADLTRGQAGTVVASPAQGATQITNKEGVPR